MLCTNAVIAAALAAGALAFPWPAEEMRDVSQRGRVLRGARHSLAGKLDNGAEFDSTAGFEDGFEHVRVQHLVQVDVRNFLIGQRG